AGGSLFQVVMPAVFVGYFVWSEKYYSAGTVLFWVGQSILNVFIYANDAAVMHLVLLGVLTGSEGGFHDWNYILSAFCWLDSTKMVAGFIRLIGTLTIISASVLTIGLAIFPPNREKSL
ncbi:MAG: hypothetical protein M3Q33_10175, partial [Acidobacteriota bacterium]|nr:hypothetical protein [Acidobacteriota bacterium]